VDRDEAASAVGSQVGPLPEADARLLAQARSGDSDAGHRFIREYYPPIYRYLLYLTGHRETAEDLTQETFLQAWRHLDQFQGRAPLQAWLHQIARRQFLQTRRCPRPVASFEEVAELPAPSAVGWTDEAELRVLLGRLPQDQQEVIVLHYLAGYSSSEIAEITQTPASTVRYRLGAARSHLAQALGQGDLAYLNEEALLVRRWGWLPLEEMDALEARLSMGGVGRWALGVGVSTFGPNAQHPTPNAPSEATEEETMERREFLRSAAAGAAGLMLPEKEVVDGRLTQKVSLALKGTALADVCEALRTETGVHLVAGNSVADEKVTVFCQKRPLREVMRQLSRPFGYTWLRSGRLGEYRYELVQDLKSQLLEEELRNRDRNEALLALEREMERYRPYLGLWPEEALARASGAGPEDKQLLEKLGRYGWGAIQMYFRLSPPQLAALRAGEKLWFRPEPEPGFQPLPADLERGIFQCQTNHRLVRSAEGRLDSRSVEDAPDGLPVTAVSELRAQLNLSMPQRELGQLALSGECGFFGGGLSNWAVPGPWAVGIGSSHAPSNGATVNARLAHDPALQRRMSVAPGASPMAKEGHKVTTADVLEALHHATSLPVISDYYTHLYPRESVSTHGERLFDSLSRLADTMRLRWNKEEEWLQFRSASFYNDRLKEVPNRLLSGWSSSRKQHGALSLEDLCEIAQLSDAQLNADHMAEGARDHLGLKEWELARDRRLRPHLRFLAGFTPEQRQKATRPAGLPFPDMPLAQQQRFITLALGDESAPLQSLEELAGATLRVDYLQPGWFQWQPPGPYWLRWFAPLGRDRRALLPAVRERTKEAALQALGRLDPQIREAVRQAARRNDPQSEQMLRDEAAQIVPTRLDVVFLYMPDTANRRSVHAVWEISDSTWSTW
jgi:RNA polymerase sigma-70 factor, ECF subfamily